MSTSLAPNQRAFLRSQANRLKPTVWIGKQGLSDEVVQAIDQALECHELLKIKILEGAPFERKELGEPLAEATGCAVVQLVGRILTVYRPSTENPRIKLPAPKDKTT